MVWYYLPLTVNFTGNPSATNGLSIQFSDSTQGSTWWNWSFGDGDSSTLQNPTHVYSQYGIYKVCLEAGNSQKKGSHCVFIEVKEILDNPDNYRFELFPIPSNGKLFLKGKRAFYQVTVEILDLHGKLFLSRRFQEIKSNELQELDLSGLPVGQYIFRIHLDNTIQIISVIII
jgi:hypothetical protein